MYNEKMRSKSKKKPEEVTENLHMVPNIFSWEAYDYHPHTRGWVWIFIFSLIVFGSAIAVLLWGGHSGSDWFMAFTFFLAAAAYFWTHRKGESMHQVQIFPKALVVDNQIYPLKEFEGYWFVYNETASIIHFQIIDKRRDRKLSLQMGNQKPQTLRKYLAKTNLPELTEKKESLLDLWIRALKL